MKFNDLLNYINIFSINEEDEHNTNNEDIQNKYKLEREKQEKEKEVFNNKFDNILDTLRTKTVIAFLQMLEDKPSITMDKINSLTLSGAIKDFIESYYLKQLETDDRMFILLNIDYFIEYVQEKVNEKFLRKD